VMVELMMVEMVLSASRRRVRGFYLDLQQT